MASPLFTYLQSSEMTLTVRFGQWMITTMESADEHPLTRLYDVTPLAVVRHAERFPGASDVVPIAFRDDSLVDIIETMIDPDTWESLGGPSSNRLFTVGERHWYGVTTSLMTHWKIEAFLNDLNGVPE